MDIRVNTEQLRTYGEQVNSGGSEYNSEINSLYETIDQLRDGWTGANQQAYLSTMDNYKSDLMKLGEVIQDIGTDLITISNTYQSLQDELTSAANNL